MAVLIRDPEADSLIRELAQRTGETITDAVKTSVQERLKRLPAQKGRINREKLAGLLAQADSRRIGPPLTAQEMDDIVGYNDEGHFG